MSMVNKCMVSMENNCMMYMVNKCLMSKSDGAELTCYSLRERKWGGRTGEGGMAKLFVD